MQLGLNGLNIVRIMSKLSQAGYKKLPDLTDFLRNPFFDSWVELVRSSDDNDFATAGKVLAPCIYHTIKGKNPKLNPLVLIHPWSGLTGAFNKLNRKLGDERDVYCVEHPYFSGMCELYVSLGEVGNIQANAILDALREDNLFWAATLVVPCTPLKYCHGFGQKTDTQRCIFLLDGFRIWQI